MGSQQLILNWESAIFFFKKLDIHLKNVFLKASVLITNFIALYECLTSFDNFRHPCGHGNVGTGSHQVLATTLTLFQPGGADYAHHILIILMSPPSFESHRRAWFGVKTPSFDKSYNSRNILPTFGVKSPSFGHSYSKICHFWTLNFDREAFDSLKPPHG